MKHIIISAALAFCCIFAPQEPVSQTVVQEIARTGIKLGEWPNLVRGKRVLTILDPDSAQKDRWNALAQSRSFNQDCIALLEEMLLGKKLRFNREIYQVPEKKDEEDKDTGYCAVLFCALALEDPGDVKTIAATYLTT